LITEATWWENYRELQFTEYVTLNVCAFFLISAEMEKSSNIPSAKSFGHTTSSLAETEKDSSFV